MPVTFNGRDVVVRFRENELNGNEFQYQVKYQCALNAVVHNVPSESFTEQDPDTQLRSYVDTLRYDENLAAGLTRSPVVSLRTQMANGNWSAWQAIEANNPLPVLVGAPLIERTLTGVQIRNVMPEDTDLVGFAVWVGDTPGFAMDDAHLRHMGASSTIDIALPDNQSHYMRIAPYDAFGLDTFSAWDEVEIKRKALGGELTESPPWQQLPDLVSTIIQEPIDRLSALQLQYGEIVVKKSVALAEGNAVAIRDLKTYVDKGGIFAEDLLQLTSRVGKNEAGLLLLNQTYASDKEATASQLIDLIARTGANESQIIIEREARTDEVQSLSQLIQTVSSKTGENTAAIQDTLKTFTDANGATVLRVEAMETRVGAAETAIRNIQSSSNNGVEALAKTVDELGVKIGTETNNREAAIQAERQVRINAEGVIASDVQTLSSAINTPGTGILAVIQRNAETAATANGARAQETLTLQSRLNSSGNGASLEQNMSTLADINGKLSSQWTIKVQQDINGRPYIAGGGLVMENGVSAMSWTVDSFRLRTPGGDSKQVFYADENGIYMDKAFIGEITANNLKVTNANIDNLSIAGEKLELNAVSILNQFSYLPGYDQRNGIGNAIFSNYMTARVDANNVPANTNVYISLAVECSGGDDGETVTWRVMRSDGVALNTVKMTVPDDKSSVQNWFWLDTVPAAGSYTYQLQGYCDTGFRYRNLRYVGTIYKR